MSKKTNKIRRYRMSDNVATELGIPLNPSKRYRLGVEMEIKYKKLVGDDFKFETASETNQYDKKLIMSALKPNGQIMTLQEYCKHYGLDYSEAKSYKLVTHTGTPFYNFASQNLNDDTEGCSVEDIKKLIQEDLSLLKPYTPIQVSEQKGGEIVVTIADLHFGAYIDGLTKTHNFSISILVDKLIDIVRIVNKHKASKVHLHILGDLIESFTGLNHKNSWKGLQKGMIGAEAVKLCCMLLHEHLLSKINNLESIKLIAGNHDRVTSDNKEDTEGDAANLIAWGLELLNYSIEFNPFIITHIVDNISYILLHGHDSISKKSTKDICWDYGKQNMFNMITEGHLHSIIEKLSVNQRKNFQTIKDDSIDHRRMNCPSLFTGNSFSERLGYTSNSGFVITENNGKGIPNVFYYAL